MNVEKASSSAMKNMCEMSFLTLLKKRVWESVLFADS